jgi:hypothetical protein
MSNLKTVAPKSKSKNPRDPRLNGKGQGIVCKLDYFPPSNTMARSEMERIAAAADQGVPVESFKLTYPFLGKAIACGLLESAGGRLIATKRTQEFISGERVASAVGELRHLLRLVVTSQDEVEIAGALARIQVIKGLKKAS